MATPSKKSPEITSFLEQTFGRTTHIENDTCVICGGPAVDFEDEISKKEYGISGMCQECQNSVFDRE